MPAPEEGSTTRLLNRFFAGDPDSAAALAEAVYGELHRLASAALPRAGGETLEPTALVHEAWLRLAGQEASFENRRQFFALAARVIRSVLVDAARTSAAQKRGGGRQRVTLSEAMVPGDAGELDFLDLHAAMERLEALDEDLHQLVELRFFGGLGNADVSAVLGVSLSTVEKRWRLARAWLRGELEP